MDDTDLDRLLYREQHRLSMARTAGSAAARLRRQTITRIFGRKVSALRYPYRLFANGRWLPSGPEPRDRA